MKYRFEEVPDEGALTPNTVNQFAGWAKGFEYLGAPINPVMNDPDEYNSFQNKDIGGILGLKDKDGNLVFLAASAATTPAPPLTAGNPTVILYGPNGQPLLTTESTAVLKNKTLGAGVGNHIDGAAIDSGTIDRARMPIVPICRLRRSSTYTIGGTVNAKVQMNSTDYDVNTGTAQADLANNRIVIQLAGYYRIWGVLHFATSGVAADFGGERAMYLKNVAGTTWDFRMGSGWQLSSSYHKAIAGSIDQLCAVGDQIEMWVESTEGDAGAPTIGTGTLLGVSFISA